MLNMATTFMRPLVFYQLLLTILTILMVGPMQITTSKAVSPSVDLESSKGTHCNTTYPLAHRLRESCDTFLSGNDSINPLSSNASGRQYAQANNVYKYMFGPDIYRSFIRPVINQSDTLNVNLQLKLFEVVALDDAKQRMTTSGSLMITWEDELTAWDGERYGYVITLNRRDIWIPKLNVYNDVDKKDFSIHDKSPLVTNKGLVIWGFEYFLTTSCTLNLEKYPFDVQICSIEIASLIYNKQALDFNITSNVEKHLLGTNSKWKVIDAIAKVDYLVTDRGYHLPIANFTLTLKRKSLFFVIRDILPPLCLSLLNLMVFFVPNDSGEKILFGVSILLSLSMFVSNSSVKLPTANHGIPAVTTYMIRLFGNCVVSVILTITAARLRHYIRKNQRQDGSLKQDYLGSEQFSNTSGEVRLYRDIKKNQGRLTSLTKVGSEQSQSNASWTDIDSSRSCSHTSKVSDIADVRQYNKKNQRQGIFPAQEDLESQDISTYICETDIDSRSSNDCPGREVSSIADVERDSITPNESMNESPPGVDGHQSNVHSRKSHNVMIMSILGKIEKFIDEVSLVITAGFWCIITISYFVYVLT